MMDDKNKARLMRELADKLDGVADTYTLLEWHWQGDHYLSTAKNLRQDADDLDPPFEVGSYVRDASDGIWRHDAVNKWSNGSVTLSTESLQERSGPLHRVYVSDPSENQVVVSIDGIYRTALLAQADKDEQEESSLTIAGIRTAKAVREQLGDSEDPRDMLSNF